MKTIVSLALPLLFCVSTAFAGNSYEIAKKVPIPGQGGGDYLIVDEGGRRVFVSHSAEVDVLDADTDEIVGKVAPTLGVHGIAVASDLGRGFASNGKSDSVTMFDLKTFKSISEIAVGKKPDAIVFDPATGRVFAFNGDGDSATAIDAASGKVAGTVALGGGPEFAASDGNGFVYNNLEDKSEVVKIDGHNLRIVERWSTAPCQSPSSMAIDRANRRLFIGCRNKLFAAMNTDTGKVVMTLPIGDHVDASAYDASSGMIFNSCGEGVVSIIHQDSPDKYSAAETVKTLPHAKTMAYDSKTGKIFLSTMENGQFEVLIVARQSTKAAVH